MVAVARGEATYISFSDGVKRVAVGSKQRRELCIVEVLVGSSSFKPPSALP